MHHKAAKCLSPASVPRATDAPPATKRRRTGQRQATKSARANEMMRRNLAALAGAPPVHQFFERLLQALMEQFNPVMCNVWHVREDGLVELAVMLADGRALKLAQVLERFPDFPTPRPFRVPPDVIGGVPASAHRRHYYLPDIREAELFHRIIGQTGIDWYVRRGVRQELNIPLHIGERGLGALSIYFGPEHRVTPEQVELAYALAQQATLTLELTRLADAETAAAIAREREQAAHEHAAEQARVNETMARSMAKLISHNDLTGFLNTLLLEAIASAGAVSGAVFLHDPANDTLVQTAHVVRGQAIDVAHDPHAAAFREPIPTRRDDLWSQLHEGPSILWEDYAEPRPARWPETADWHQAMGHRFAAVVPMMYDGRPVGMVGVAWDQAVATRPEDSRMRICQALAQHATLAVRLTRLAEDARSVAVARERERAERERAAALTKTNAALRSNLAVLSSAPQIDLFFDHLLRAFVDQLNPVMCNVWQVREDGLVELDIMLVDGQALKLAQVLERFPDFPSPTPFHVPSEILDGETVATRQRHFYLPDIRKAEMLHRLVGQTGIDWYVRRGVRQELNIPLHIGERGLGALSIFLDAGYVVTPEKMETAFALARQAALALELTRLADAEKTAAVARGREQAAQEQTAELTRINEALSRSIAKLVSHNDLTGFLNAVLLEAIAHSGAVSGTVFLHDQARGVLTQTAHVVRGRVVDVARDPAVALFREPIPTEGNDIWRMVIEDDGYFWADYAHPHPAIWPETAAWHRAMGHRFAVGVPMMQGAEPAGVLGLAWDHSVETRPSDASLKICLALTQQATMAVRLTRLAEEARTAAVAREREQAARDRAAQLERANAVLSKTIETLAVEQSPEAFLEATLHAVAAALDADSVTMWRWPGDGYAHLHRVLEAGVIVPGEKSDHPDAGRPALIADDPWAQKVSAAGTRTIDVLNVNERPGLAPVRTAHLRSQGVRALVVSAIRSGNTTVGTFTARLRDDQPDPTPEQIALVQSLAAHAALALEMSRLTEAVRVGATREERTRIARDLHDSLAQGFTGIIVQLEAVGSALASEDLAKAHARATAAGELARDSLQQARRAVHALRPSILEGKDLPTALKQLVESTFMGSAVEVETCFSGVSRPLRPDAEEHLLRIAQEALTNAFKHAQAHHVGVCLTYQPDEIALKIHDDGRGFDPSNRRPGSHGGLGLVGIRERADRLGAALTIENQADGGACVSVTLPTSGRTPGRT